MQIYLKPDFIFLYLMQSNFYLLLHKNLPNNADKISVFSNLNSGYWASVLPWDISKTFWVERGLFADVA